VDDYAAEQQQLLLRRTINVTVENAKVCIVIGLEKRYVSEIT